MRFVTIACVAALHVFAAAAHAQFPGSGAIVHACHPCIARRRCKRWRHDLDVSVQLKW